MKMYEKELKPVHYSDSGIKVLSFAKSEGQNCFRMHWHERVEIIRVRKGVIRIFFGTEEHLVKAGQLAFFSPEIPHRGIAEHGACEYDAVMFDVRSFLNDTKLCKHLLSAIVEGRAKFCPVIDREETVAAVDQMITSAGCNTLESISTVYHFLDLILQYELVSWSDELHFDRDIKEILRYIHTNFSKDVTTASLSRQFGYSSAHFCRKFKDATSLSPMKYLQIFRLEAALKMLHDGDRSISTIAAECGFSDQNYFSRCFKAHFGVPPRDFEKL